MNRLPWRLLQQKTNVCMDIGIFGGSFNPPHIAHLVVAESVRDQFGLDRVLWIPGYIPPHKTRSKLADARHRLEMTRLATAGNPTFEVSSIEIDRKGTSYTVDTVTSLCSAHPDDTFYLIIGEDSLRDFISWRKPATIISKVSLLVYRRTTQNSEQSNQNPPLSEAERQFPDRIRFADAPLLNISSASIRAQLQKGRSIRHQIPDSVHDYIKEYHLYLHR